MRYIATSETYRSISDRFGVTISSTHRAVRRCTTAVVQIADQYICWPDEAKQAEIKNKFKAIKGLPGVIGAVDGTHISIRKPTDHPQSYLNRKKDYSIILQNISFLTRVTTKLKQSRLCLQHHSFKSNCTVIHNFVIQREGTHLDDEFDDEDNLQPPNLDVPTRLAFQKRDMLKMSIQ
ncbi:unnamed protein product [Mytilus coruscus]|uniref:Nuclease HARBI1 n=1 Tax=Mytilus coruscus TaxID=42192 RepID=A0A6J8AZ15_MYTCO|nr:unnamed protein product [Mytilus coruscus]